MAKYLDLAGLTAYDAKIKEWIKSGTVDITDDEIRALFITPILYQMVDLGLSVKWADRNVGAENPQDAGLYFDWGNVDGHAVDENGNTVDGYSFGTDTYSATLGGQYKGKTLDTEHDTATANIGEGWRMPTVDEIDELVENTDHYCISEDGSILAESELGGSINMQSVCFVKKGEYFDYNNRSNFIEIPFSGRCNNSLLGYDGEMGGIWSSTLTDRTYGQYSRILILSTSNSGAIAKTDLPRSYGYPVRGVHA